MHAFVQVNPEDFPLCGASLMPWLASLPRLQDLTLQGVPKEWALHASSLTSLKALNVLGYNVNDSAPRRLYNGLSCLQSLTSIQVGCHSSQTTQAFESMGGQCDLGNWELQLLGWSCQLCRSSLCIALLQGRCDLPKICRLSPAKCKLRCEGVPVAPSRCSLLCTV